MKDNSNKPRGIILIITSLALTLLIIFGLISLCLSKGLSTWGYKDPVVSQSNVRGIIYDKNGRILAIQAPSYGFTINKSQNNIQQISSFLSQYSDYDALEIAALLENGISFIPLSSSLSNPQYEVLTIQIKEDNLEDYLSFSDKEIRNYPYHIASNILGYSPIPSKGVGGVEELFNSELLAIPEVGKTTVHGSSLTLTLDYEIQALLEEIVKENNIKDDAAIISDKGYILAYCGKEDLEVVDNIVRFITPPQSVTTERALSVPSRMLDGIAVGPYFVWSDGNSSSLLAEKMEMILKIKGKI